ncbi:exodeoxyribonuclease III [Robiginitomaculum antarcticum]|uniref:exodeoxyribonuclease III n=1 Tax=Robiginitomaculum antarcticum TaxID=437507 RepID=UPI0003712E89|nr:exodeoxyribonuclease III [Robiginitomaculum antarcticum]
MDIATFNVNSIKARLHAVTQWLDDKSPDIACLQELKTVDGSFPREEIEARGYNIITHGQKSYNGVAILSKFPIEEHISGLPGDESDEQARYIEAVISAPQGAVRVASIYLPNGNPAPGPKYDYKLAWMARLKSHIQRLLGYEEPLILAGDYNVIPRPEDCFDPAAWIDDALFRPDTRAAFREIIFTGLTSAFMQKDGRGGEYTFWDYQAGAWPRGNGIRIDHLLLSPQAADKLQSVRIDKYVRDKDRPSDHVPFVGSFDL